MSLVTEITPVRLFSAGVLVAVGSAVGDLSGVGEAVDCGVSVGVGE